MESRGNDVKWVARTAVEWPLRHIGYRIVPCEPAVLDFRGITEDALEALYLSREKPFLVDVDLARLRGNGDLGFPFARGAGNPLVDTVDVFLQDRCSRFRGSPLETFYRRWTPANAAETLRVPPESASRALTALPPYATLCPWFLDTPPDFLEVRERWTRAEHRQYGLDLGAEHGTLANGPWSDAKGDLEMERLTAVADSIREHGYLPEDHQAGHVYGHLLVRGTDWRIKLRNGNHRVAALAAIGVERMPILVNSTTGTPRREEAASWPNVRRGVFSVQVAQSIFDRIFDGANPAEYVSERIRPLAALTPSHRGWQNTPNTSSS
jgi:hypothetical protein